MTLKNTVETAAQTTIPIPVGISGLSWWGVTVKDWVLMATAILLVFQLIVIAPKAFRVLMNTYRLIKQGVNHYGESFKRTP